MANIAPRRGAPWSLVFLSVWHPAGVLVGKDLFSRGTPGIDFKITNQTPFVKTPFHTHITPPPPAGANSDSLLKLV